MTKKLNEAQAAAFLKEKLSDPMWRIQNLYKIMIKGDDDTEGLVMKFKPNAAQMKFIRTWHHRNIIIKSRQLGFTTLIAIIWLDHALFNPDSRCAIIAHDLSSAEVIFRDKVKFAYNNLPEEFKKAMPLVKDSASELLFAHNNSSIRVGTSMRSGTIHRLHISEFGKICAKYPERAREVVTGSIPAVPLNGVTVIESTAEGTEGELYEMSQVAMAVRDTGRDLTKKDYKFHFFPWYGEAGYRMPTDNVLITPKDNEYFDSLEASEKVTIDPEQRAWYVSTRDTDFAGNADMMNQEYPSTASEAFRVSTEGCYYTTQMTAARKQGRVIQHIPEISNPVFTFWDIGNSDGCAVWFMQQVGMEYRFIDYLEGHGETLKYYMREIQNKPYVYDKHFLPHDAAHKKLSDTNRSTKQMLEDLGLRNAVIVPVISDINAGIQMTREAFGACWFDETKCKLGLQRLENYKKKWNESAGRWSDEPKHDINSEGADAFRQFGQAKYKGLITKSGYNTGYVEDAVSNSQSFF